jgi:hypothetical protein
MARDRMSPVGLEGKLEVEVDWRASAEWLKYEVPARYVGGIPEPDISSVSTAEVASMAGVVTSVTEDKGWKVDGLPLVLAPDERKHYPTLKPRTLSLRLEHEIHQHDRHWVV